jgi:hypothetical protein
MGVGLRMFQCRVRAGGSTLTVECLAPSALAAAHAVVVRVRQTDDAPWHQVVACEWSPVIGEYLVPVNAIIVAAEDPPAEGADHVIFAADAGGDEQRESASS